MSRILSMRRFRRARDGRPGFTLVEVMVAAGILAGTVAAALYLFAGTSRAILYRENVVSATGLAYEKAEYLLQQSFAGMSNGSDSIGKFRRSWSISNDTSVAWIAVTVAWNEADGANRHVDVRRARAP